ncbi:hypothetical protein [Dinghuibacter silviterrae]|uniref:Uncharacterized protein n=1 Tax=Dinghuibacter silviterrae TaxID=1539049 RepID=A0A4R8DGG5_9BACT|nr:hypothetical protein [Dinghuibacter silviterrae]TDW96751.1 hypothetical protein EDB95_4587 [Dinghuibacter silviterrae]
MSPALRYINIAIGVVTVLSGAVQTVAPAFILRLVHAETSATATQSFAIVGFFMVLFGGLLIQSLVGASPRGPAAPGGSAAGEPLRPSPRAAAPLSGGSSTAFLPSVFWCGLQKVGASVAVFVGIYHGVFGGLAAAVASFDGLSAILILGYWWAVRRARTIP